MALDKRAVVESVTMMPNGTISVRFAKQVIDGDSVIASEWHRLIIAPSENIPNAIIAANADLTASGYGPCGDTSLIQNMATNRP